MRSKAFFLGGLLTTRGFESLFAFLLVAFVVLPVFALPDIQKVGPDDSKKLVKQAERAIRRGKLTEAEQFLRTAVAANPKDSLAKLKLAYVYVKMRRLVEAYELSYPVAKVEPKNSYAFAVLGATMLGAGRFKDARVFFVNSIRIDRSESLAWSGLGMVEFYENDIAESLANLQEAVHRYPCDSDYIYALTQV